MPRWERAISTLFLSLALLMVSGCGGGGGTTPPPPPGSAPMTLFVRDAGAEKLLAFEIQLTGAALVSGTTEQSILAAPVELELKNLQLATMPLSLNNVREGTYTTLRLTFANPEATVLTSTGTVVKCETGAACVPTASVAEAPSAPARNFRRLKRPSRMAAPPVCLRFQATRIVREYQPATRPCQGRRDDARVC